MNRDASVTRRQRLLPAIAFAAILLLGGSAQFMLPNDMFCRLAACLLMLLLIVQRQQLQVDRQAMLLWAGIILLPAIQLIPLGTTLWSHLPGRASLAEALAAADVTSVRGQISLAPGRTFDSLLFLIAPFAGFLFGTAAFGRERHPLFLTLVVIALASVLLSAAQLAQPSGGAYLYRITNEGSAVGIFANRNHNASLMAVAIAALIPLVTASLAKARVQQAHLALQFGLALLFLCFAFATQSRAGAALAAVAFAALLWRARHSPQLRAAFARGGSGWAQRNRPMLLVAAISVTALLIWAFIASGMTIRFSRLFDENFNRAEVYHLTLRAIADNWLTGTGIGSFQWAIVPYEQFSQVGFAYWNHAHSGPLQLAMEGGILGVAFIILFFAWLIANLRQAWTRQQDSDSGSAGVFAAGLIVGLLLLHSLVDYPLRTAALAAAFAACCGYILAAKRPASR